MSLRSSRPKRVVILAGGMGTRLSEETYIRPKPMVEIGERPIIWHIMSVYAAFGLTDFIICAGYKGHVLKEYFANYHLLNSDVTFDLRRNTMTVHQVAAEPWRVTVVDTGIHTQTGGRVRRIRPYLEGEDFCLTYGDGLANVNINALLDCHYQAGRLATITAVRPPVRFGAIEGCGDRVVSFREKHVGDIGWINGGFFVMSHDVLDYIKDDSITLEIDCLPALARDSQLTAYYHHEFWLGMDTLRDRHQLEELWASNRAPWKTW
jgi:glucose-1-phosphate cytidylyltransferase